MNANIKENGFSLIEVLVVLFIFFIAISISLVSVQPLYRHFQINHFIQQLRTDVSYAQIYAISHHANTTISFNPTQNKYYVYSGGPQNTIMVRRYPAEIELQFSTLPKNVMFLYNGNISQSGSMSIKYYKDTYSFVFLFGKGLTYASKL